MIRNRKVFFVFVALNLSPGVMHTVESAQRVLQGFLNNLFGAYYPVVEIGPTSMSQGSRVRGFIVRLDLDPVPGEMHTVESAQSVLLDRLREYLSPYNPTVHVAPDTVQESVGATT